MFDGTIGRAQPGPDQQPLDDHTEPDATSDSELQLGDGHASGTAGGGNTEPAATGSDQLELDRAEPEAISASDLLGGGRVSAPKKGYSKMRSRTKAPLISRK